MSTTRNYKKKKGGNAGWPLGFDVTYVTSPEAVGWRPLAVETAKHTQALWRPPTARTHGSVRSTRACARGVRSVRSVRGAHGVRARGRTRASTQRLLGGTTTGRGFGGAATRRRLRRRPRNTAILQIVRRGDFPAA